jgi:hypothetical protein
MIGRMPMSLIMSRRHSFGLTRFLHATVSTSLENGSSRAPAASSFEYQIAAGRKCTFPRHGFARVMHRSKPPEDRGRRECRVQAAPMARLQQKTQAAVTTGKAGATGIPCAMGLRLIACSPWCPGFDSHHRQAKHLFRAT